MSALCQQQTLPNKQPPEGLIAQVEEMRAALFRAHPLIGGVGFGRRPAQELRHYGFIGLAKHGFLGVDGKGKSPHWRLTELGQTRQTSAKGIFEPPTRDFLKWDSKRFVKPVKPEKQNPASHGGTVCILRGMHRAGRQCIPRGMHNQLPLSRD